MKQSIFMEKYPIYTFEVHRNEIAYKDVNEICAYFINKISSHPKATHIALFNHYEHTKSLSDGEIAPNIKDAKNVVFCFGQKIPNPQMLAVRPRSIGICDLGDKFMVTFLETPLENVNKTMREWVMGLKKT